MSNRLPAGYRFYWDDHCKLCNTIKSIVTALDWSNRVTFIPLLDEAADFDLGHLTFEERMASSHLVDPDGRACSRGQAMMGLAALLPLTAPFVFLFQLLPKSDLMADKIYGFIARHRGVPYGGTCSIDLSDDGQSRSC